MSDNYELSVPVHQGLAASLEHEGFRVAKRVPPSAISGHLRDELIRILTTGDDKNEGAFTIAIATQVEKFAIAARAILMTENLAQNDLSALLAMRDPHGGGTWPLGPVGVRGLSSPLMGMGVNNENFGVQVIRQLVDAARTIGESPAKLVEALAVARANGLDDVVMELEKKLGISRGIQDSITEGVP